MPLERSLVAAARQYAPTGGVLVLLSIKPLFDPLNLVLEDGIFVTQLTSFYVLYGN